ncbi:MAG: T9SS type A sorting domain-containing protein [Lewinellaceae bacterium]|nr:T9SS type A sorting domain-containing protein [Lewinellaceae bacterium]
MKLRVLLQALALLLLVSPVAQSQTNVSCIDANLSVVGGATEIITCEGDGIATTYRFKVKPFAMPFGYLVTDENNIILHFGLSNVISFEGLGGGNLRVWAFSFLGTPTVHLGEDATTAQLATLCWNLTNNYIPVINFVPDAGAVSTVDGNTSAFVCTGDGTPDVLEFTNTSTAGQQYAYLITDENNVIIDIASGSSYDFEGSAEGVYRVWGLAHGGNIEAMVGDTVGVSQLAGDCYGVSENFIEVTSSQPDGGTVELSNGTASTTICVEDGVADVLSFTHQSAATTAYVYLITDENNTIIEVVDTDNYDFESPGSGEWRVWGLSYTGNLLAAPGQDAGTATLSSDCFDLSDNYITVIRQVAEGGSVALDNGDTEALACVGDGEADLFTFTNDSPGADNYTYLITDENNIILAFAPDGTFDFDGAGTGICRVWGLAYAGNLLAEVGDDAASVVLADGCFGLSANFITISRETAIGGEILFSDGSNLKYTCPGDGNADLLSFDSTGAVGSFTYLITDEQGIILNIPAGDSFDFDGAPVGISYIWGLAYSGSLTAAVGDTASASVLSDGCFSLSDNYIAVITQTPEAGQVETEDGETTVYTCPGDGNPDIVRFDSVFAGITPFVYVITDENDVILGFPGTDNFDFDVAPPGNCHLWGLAYTGSLTASPGDTLTTATLSDDCFDLSNNFITIVRELPEGGTVATEDGETTVYTCPGDGNPDIVRFDSTGTSSGPYAYIITDTNNVILALPAGDSQDFDAAPTGICRAWGLAYTGNLTAVTGDTASLVNLSDDCFSLSENYITVIRQAPDGGTVATEDGATEVAICPGDGNPDIIRFDSTGTSGPYAYVITDENNIILSILSGDEVDFDIAGVGISRVWGLAYTGSITAVVGDDAGAVQLSDDCFDLSDNYVAVIRQVPVGGIVATENGETEVYVCPGDGMPNIVSADSSGTQGLYTYVITDENNVILNIPAGDSFDFDNAPAGTCHIWGLAYSGTLTAVIGDDATAVALSDDCFDLSDNYITVVRVTPDGGTVARQNGTTEVYICPGDGSPDIVSVDSSGTAGLYTYVITDENNIIVSLPTGDSFDFDSTPTGVLRIWGLAYTGNLTAAIGDDAAAVSLSDDCFDLSDNFVTVTLETPDAGLISSGAGPVNVEICVGDAFSDVVEFVVDGASNSNYLYIVTDENDFIISALDTTAFNFNNALAGTYRVYGLAFTGNPIVIPGDNIFDISLSTDCYDLTDNFLEISAIGVDGATIFTSAGVGVTELNLCVGDGVADLIQFFATTSATDASYTFAVTNEDNIVIGFIPGDEFNFELAGPGIAKIWGISYTGTLTLNIGDDITTAIPSSACYDFAAEPITIIRDLPEGGMVSSNGATAVQVCPGPDSGIVPLETSSTAINAYVYILTDTSNVALGIYTESEVDFVPLPVGYYHVWGLSYTGFLNAFLGQDVTTATLSSSCFELSGNFVSVYRGPDVDGGAVSTVSGLDTIYTCPDGIPDLVIMETSSADANYRYIITNGNNRVIVADVESNFIDFEGAAPGIYHIWGVSLNGDILLGFNDDILTEQVASDCYQLSDNYITVVREAPNGGLVLTGQGEDVVNVIVGDSIPDEITFVSIGAAPNAPFTYVITDADNVILEMLNGDTKDFEDDGPGVSRVWGLSYTGAIIAAPGDTASVAALSDDCWDLSDNFVVVNRIDSPGFAEEQAGEQAGTIQSLVIAPNPASENIVASFRLSEEAAPVSRLRILDSRGQAVENLQVLSVPGENRYELQATSWQAGLYIVYLNNGGDVKVKKLIVVRP